MAHEASGKIIEIFDTQQISEKFSKRELILEIPDGNYPQQVKFQVTQDKCSLLDQYKAGDEVKVNFNLQGKAFTKDGKTNWFNNLGIWRIELSGQQSSPTSNTATSGGSTQNMTVSGEEDNDLPF